MEQYSKEAFGEEDMEESRNVQKSQLLEKVAKKAENLLLDIVRLNLNENRASERVSKLREKYAGFPSDYISAILIKRAVRKTVISGATTSAGITGCEVAISAAPITVGGILGLILADISYTVRVQMQLILDIAESYNAPLSKDDEDDVWFIFKAALGIKGTEQVGGFTRILFYDTAKTQFRNLLRAGLIRKTAQEWVKKRVSKRIAKYLAEKYLMRLIPALNVILGAVFNQRVTKAVGKWAKVKAKMRSSTFSQIDVLKSQGGQALIWVLPIIFHIGTANDKLTDNLLSIYSLSNKRLDLIDDELKKVEDLVNEEGLSQRFAEELPKIHCNESRMALFDIAVTSAAVNMNPTKNQHRCLGELADLLKIDYKEAILKKKIKHLKQ